MVKTAFDIFFESESINAPAAVRRRPADEESPRGIRIPRLINDVTLDWNETMHRPWLSFFNRHSSNSSTTSSATLSANHPPYMIVLSDSGWNHPNQTYGLSQVRTLREREIFQGIVNHPYFHPTAWRDIRDGTLPISANASFHYYVFADVMQCYETNYPNYEGKLEGNTDGFHNRSTDTKSESVRRCLPDPKNLGFSEHPLFQHATTRDATTNNNNIVAKATLVSFNCRGFSSGCRKHRVLPTSVAAIGGEFSKMEVGIDQGLMPPAPNPVRLSEAEELAIANCDAEHRMRPLKVVFVGNFRREDGRVRVSFRPFHNPSEGVVIATRSEIDDLGSIVTTDNKTMLEKPTYNSLLRSTKFALVPRGDAKFSYRITEALSAGAIPVFHADDYLLPFRPELVDWDKCSLFLPEKDAGHTTIDLLLKMAEHPNATTKLCSMRKYCYFEIYQKYVSTTTKQITGLVEGLEALARGERKEHAGIICNKTSVESLDCSPR